jgi:predicted HTH transcriptional regulator
VAHYIQTLIVQGEHQHLDFKFEINDARKIARSFVAFANSEGGKLLIGVKDNGSVAGVRTEEEHYMIEAAASYYCLPPVPYSVRKWELEGKTVLEVDIPEGKDKPYLVKLKEETPKAYVRIADENIRASHIQVMAWKKQKYPSGLLIDDAENQSRLLHYMETLQPVSLNMVCKTLMLTRKKAEHLLADMVYLNVLDILYQDDKVLFRIKNKPDVF